MKTFLLWNYKLESFLGNSSQVFLFTVYPYIKKYHLILKLQQKTTNLKAILNSAIFKIQFTTFKNYCSNLP